MSCDFCIIYNSQIVYNYKVVETWVSIFMKHMTHRHEYLKLHLTVDPVFFLVPDFHCQCSQSALDSLNIIHMRSCDHIQINLRYHTCIHQSQIHSLSNPMTDLEIQNPIQTVYCLLNLFITLHKMKFITGITSDNMHGFVICKEKH